MRSIEATNNRFFDYDFDKNEKRIDKKIKGTQGTLKKYKTRVAEEAAGMTNII